MTALPAADLLLCARVPAYSAPAWFGERRHPESTDDFGTLGHLQHIARTLAGGGFELLLIDPPQGHAASCTLDPGLCAVVLAQAAPLIRVGLRRPVPRRTAQADPSRLLGAQWAGIAPVPIACSVRVLVGSTRWMAEDQFAFVQQHFPLPEPLGTEATATPHEPEASVLVGTPSEIVDDLERLLASQDPQAAPEGPRRTRPAVELVPIHIPGSYEAFVRMVVPQLRRRGLISEHGGPWRPIT
jgi:hypothetical protein